MLFRSLHANRAPSVFGRMFVGYAYAEGWAHYSEEMMWEAGLGDGDPEVHIGQLSNALLRNCRFLSAIRLHTAGMTIAQSTQFFETACFQDAGTAEQQARRGAYDPAYLNYTLGKLMIRKLRADWTATRGGRAGWKAFHNAPLGASTNSTASVVYSICQLGGLRRKGGRLCTKCAYAKSGSGHRLGTHASSTQSESAPYSASPPAGHFQYENNAEEMR